MTGISSCGGGGGGGNGGGGLPNAPTFAVGTVVGNPVTAMIGASGGTVASTDGRITLSIPSGALSANTTIGVQAISNTAPNGGGLAFRLSAGGVTFSQPVTLVWHLSDAEVTSIDDIIIARQDASGHWMVQPAANISRDVNAKTVSVTIAQIAITAVSNATAILHAAASTSVDVDHSDWADLQTLVLKPDAARVRVTESVDFDPQISFLASDDLLAAPAPIAAPAPTELTGQGTDYVWAVNGAPGGTAGTGLIWYGRTSIAADYWKGHYTAPPNVPNPNPLTISLSVSVGNKKMIAVASVDVFAQEQWTGDATVTSIDGTRMDATFTFVQVPSTVNSTLFRFEIMQGTVHITPPATTSAGCPLSVTPTTYTMSAKDGNMTADYSILANGPTSPMVTGGGSTVWMATYTTICSAGPYSFPSSAGGDWWPVPPGGGTPVLATDGKATIAVNNGIWSGTVNLTRK